MSPERLIVGFDRMLRTLCVTPPLVRPRPGEGVAEGVFDDQTRNKSIGLMRINHSGEVCAQALYQGQALAAQERALADLLQQAADEENEHLAWTADRLDQLGGRPSLFNPLWFAGSFLLGALAGKLGKGWNLGFLAETERQVEAHLDDHLARLPEQDAPSRAVLSQMKIDEARHAAMAERHGGIRLPQPVRIGMRAMAAAMKAVSYRF